MRNYLYLILSALVSTCFATPSWIFRNSSDGTLRLDSRSGDLYRSIGVSLYPFWAGSYEYTRKLMLFGLANGVTSYRAVLIFEQLNGNPDQTQLWSDDIWMPIDSLLNNANVLGVHVTLELSGLANWMSSLDQPLDPYNSTNYPLWDQLVDFCTSRVNTLSGIAYSDEPAIFAYTVLGEVEPSPRSVQPGILALLKHVSARLKKNDPNHLVGSGGLLHMSQYSGYNDPVLYWEKLYAVSSVDVCMIHIYQHPDKVFNADGTIQTNQWSLLSTYARYCASIGKPFIIDEFGLQLDAYSRSTDLKYFSYAFETAFKVKPAIPVVQIWNWQPGPTFNVFPNEELLLLQVVRKNARRWGFQGNFGFNPADYPTQRLFAKTMQLVDFEGGSTAGASSTQTLSVSQTRASSGNFSLMMPWSFPDYKYQVKLVTLSPGATKWSNDFSNYIQQSGKLSCDVYIEAQFPVMPTSYGIQFSIQGQSGRIYMQTQYAVWTNFLMLYQWNTVSLQLDYNALDREIVNGGGISYTTWNNELSAIKSFSVGLVHKSTLKGMSGSLFLDACRLEVIEDSFLATSIDGSASAASVDCSSSSGSGTGTVVAGPSLPPPSNISAESSQPFYFDPTLAVKSNFWQDLLEIAFVAGFVLAIIGLLELVATFSLSWKRRVKRVSRRYDTASTLASQDSLWTDTGSSQATLASATVNK